jgi:HYD1 signature containing ADP-ribosyltransferase
MTNAERILIRLRHYTRTSSKERILSEERIVARDQNKIFVERADRSPLSPRQAETTYLLKRGKGNAYIEFDAFPEEIHVQTNSLTGTIEFFLLGDVDLSMRHPQGFDNR